MRVVLQVVDNANVKVNDEVVGCISKGYLLLVGIFEEDNAENVVELAEKISKLRVFPDGAGKTNLSLKDVNGEILSVSQFTLCADLKGVNRPSFSKAAKRDKAIELYELFNLTLKNLGFKVETGEFGEDMEVNLLNKGPFTVIVDN